MAENECWDPRCTIPEHRRIEEGLGSALTDSECLALRNILLASKDFGLTPDEAIAVSWAKAILHHRATAPASSSPEPASSEGERWYICRHGKYADEHQCDDHRDHAHLAPAPPAEAAASERGES